MGTGKGMSKKARAENTPTFLIDQKEREEQTQSIYARQNQSRQTQVQLLKRFHRRFFSISPTRAKRESARILKMIQRKFLDSRSLRYTPSKSPLSEIFPGAGEII
jgi:hypothetical protein